MKDFIVAFFGWFVLMGKNGLRVGDWVEINGVAGEVVEINLLRTVLLETGNWTDTGHPTGRKVAFVNSYAIEGHFFNFTTSGQWMWDELTITVPPNQDPYPLLDAIQKTVVKETETNAAAAEKEWQNAASNYKVSSVSAAPVSQLAPHSRRRGSPCPLHRPRPGTLRHPRPLEPGLGRAAPSPRPRRKANLVRRKLRLVWDVGWPTPPFCCRVPHVSRLSRRGESNLAELDPKMPPQIASLLGRQNQKNGCGWPTLMFFLKVETHAAGVPPFNFASRRLIRTSHFSPRAEPHTCTTR